jgi:protein-S-isoprenylcysteine O-methyltransferase Ste14
MTADDRFRLALLAIFATCLTIGVYHRRRAAASPERISRRDEGLAMFLALRLSGLLLFVATLLHLIEPSWMRRASIPFGTRLRWSGLAVAAMAIPLMAWTLQALGRNLTDTVVTRSDHTLVTAGPYRWVRHPYYVTTLLLVVAVTLITANGLIGTVGLIVFVLLAVRSRIEEQKLIERFGDDYRTYIARTGRFIPRLRRQPPPNDTQSGSPKR